MESMHLVLIETYWNVKIDNRYIAHKESKVLIETYWNVNISRKEYSFGSPTGINRNILECKYPGRYLLSY